MLNMFHLKTLKCTDGLTLIWGVILHAYLMVLFFYQFFPGLQEFNCYYYYYHYYYYHCWRYFNQGSQVVLRRMLSDWERIQRSTVRSCERQEDDIKKYL